MTRRAKTAAPAAKEVKKEVQKEVKKEVAKVVTDAKPRERRPRARTAKLPAGNGSYAGDIGAALGGLVGGPVGDILGRGLGDVGSLVWNSITGSGEYELGHQGIEAVLSAHKGKPAHEVLKQMLPAPYAKGDKYYYPGVESLGSVKSSTGFFTTPYRLNAGSATTFPMLSVEASTWVKYGFRKMFFIVVPLDTSSVSSFATLGWHGGAGSLDPEQLTLGTLVAPGPFSSKQAIENYGMSATKRGDQLLVVPIECSSDIGGTTSRFVQADGAVTAYTGPDARLNDMGDFYYATSDFQTGGVTIGELFVVYDAVLEVRQQPPFKPGMDILVMNTSPATSPPMTACGLGAGSAGNVSEVTLIGGLSPAGGGCTMPPGFWLVGVYGSTSSGTMSIGPTLNFAPLSPAVTVTYQTAFPTAVGPDVSSTASYLSGANAGLFRMVWITGGDAYLQLQAGTGSVAAIQYWEVHLCRFPGPTYNIRSLVNQFQLSKEVADNVVFMQRARKVGLLPKEENKRDDVLISSNVLAVYQRPDGTTYQRQWPYSGPIPPEGPTAAACSPEPSLGTATVSCTVETVDDDTPTTSGENTPDVVDLTAIRPHELPSSTSTATPAPPKVLETGAAVVPAALYARFQEFMSGGRSA